MRTFRTTVEFLRYYFPKEWKRLVEEEKEEERLKRLKGDPWDFSDPAATDVQRGPSLTSHVTYDRYPSGEQHTFDPLVRASSLQAGLSTSQHRTPSSLCTARYRRLG